MGPNHISREELVNEIQSVADKIGRAPSLRETDKLGDYSRSTYQDRFGNWNTAVREAGLEPEHDPVPKQISDTELLEELNRIATTLERTPRQQDMDNFGEYSVTTYRNHFGSWNDALQQAGYEPAKRYGIDREE